MDEKNNLQYNKGHVKDIKINRKIGEYLEHDSQLHVVFKKTEKLTTATYLITDFFDKDESLKWQLRSVAISFLSFIISLAETCDSSGQRRSLLRVRACVAEILSLLELACRINLISSMNFSILHDEYYRLGKLLENQIQFDGPLNDFVFPENFLSEPSLDKIPNSFNENSADKRQNKIQTNESGSTNGKGQYHKGHNNMSFIRTNDSDKNSEITPADRKFLQQQQIGQRERRREMILRILKTKGEVNIKDISSAITGCSEKTLQRELMSLMALGIVKRRGERRWSTYVLVRE